MYIIKFDFKLLVRNYIWFGWMWVPERVITIHDVSNQNVLDFTTAGYWERSTSWNDKLVPVKRWGHPNPLWWRKIGRKYFD